MCNVCKDLKTDEYIEVVKTTLSTANSIEEFKRRIDTFGFKEEGERVTTSRGLQLTKTFIKEQRLL